MTKVNLLPFTLNKEAQGGSKENNSELETSKQEIQKRDLDWREIFKKYYDPANEENQKFQSKIIPELLAKVWEKMTEEQFLKLKDNPSWLELTCKVCDECYLSYTQVFNIYFTNLHQFSACATVNDLKANAQQTQYKDSILKLILILGKLLCLRKHKELLQAVDMFPEDESSQNGGMYLQSKGHISESHTSLQKKQQRKSNFYEVKQQAQQQQEQQDGKRFQQQKKEKQLPSLQKKNDKTLNNAEVTNKSDVKGLTLEEFIRKEKSGRRRQFVEVQKQSANTTKNEQQTIKKNIEQFFAKPVFKSDPKSIYFTPITPQCRLPKISKLDNSDALSSSTNTSARSKPTFEFMLTTIKDLKQHLTDLQ